MNKNPVAKYNGYIIVEDLNMVDYVEIQVKRTFLDKLLSFNWKDEYKTKTITKPKTEAVIYRNKIIVHPSVAKEMYEEIKNVNK